MFMSFQEECFKLSSFITKTINQSAKITKTTKWQQLLSRCNPLYWKLMIYVILLEKSSWLDVRKWQSPKKQFPYLCISLCGRKEQMSIQPLNNTKLDVCNDRKYFLSNTALNFEITFTNFCFTRKRTI